MIATHKQVETYTLTMSRYEANKFLEVHSPAYESGELDGVTASMIDAICYAQWEKPE